MIDYILLNWIDLGTLLVLIFILSFMNQCTNFINETLHVILSKIEDIKLKR